MEPIEKIDKIEITDEMIEAAETILSEALGGAVSCHWYPRDLAKQVLRGALLVRNADRPKSNRQNL